MNLLAQLCPCGDRGPAEPMTPRRAAAAAASAELLAAAADGDLPRLAAALDAPGCDINGCGDHAWTALHFAAAGGHEECVDRLLRRGADTRARSVDDLTPLHVAAGGGRAASVAIKNQLVGGSLLSSDGRLGPAEAGHESVVRTLLHAGADAEDEAIHGIRALHLAAAVADLEIIRALLAAGADPRARLTVPAGSITTAAHIADEYGHAEAAALLAAAEEAAASAAGAPPNGGRQ